MLTSIIACGSLVISVISLVSSIRTKKYQKKKDDKLLKPQLFLESKRKQTVDYIGIDWEFDDHYEKFKEYGISMIFTNITDAKILDLFISIDVKKTETFDFLLSSSLEEKEGHIYLEKDIDDNDIYTWEKVFGVSEKKERKIDILNGGESFEIDLPAIYIALLMGAMFSYREGINQSDSEIEFDINISYKHVFSDEYIKIKKPLIVNITYENAIQGPYIVYDSIIFNQL